MSRIKMAKNLEAQKTVLVYLGDATRPVMFSRGEKELIAAIYTRFSDVLSTEDKLLLKVCSCVFNIKILICLWYMVGVWRESAYYLIIV